MNANGQQSENMYRERSRPASTCEIVSVQSRVRENRTPGHGAHIPMITDRDTLDLHLDGYSGGVALWGAVPPVYDTTEKALDRGIHVHARKTSGGDKLLDETVRAVRIVSSADEGQGGAAGVVGIAAAVDQHRAGLSQGHAGVAPAPTAAVPGSASRRSGHGHGMGGRPGTEGAGSAGRAGARRWLHRPFGKPGAVPVSVA